MEFTDGLFRHLFHTGYVPLLLILDFQLSLYLSLWTEMYKTLPQNQNHKPFQTIRPPENEYCVSWLPSSADAKDGKRK